MESTITHFLDGMGQARYGREKAVKSWIRGITYSLDGMGQAQYGREIAVKAPNRRSLTR